ncbi:MAG: outer membrane beta-barrel protein [Ferruginibacter sp.]
MTSDMDELYRSAAENYPLNTGKPDWDAMLTKINLVKKHRPPAKRNIFKGLLFLIAFTPLALSDLHFFKIILPTQVINNETQKTTAQINPGPAQNIINPVLTDESNHSTISMLSKKPGSTIHYFKQSTPGIIKEKKTTVSQNDFLSIQPVYTNDNSKTAGAPGAEVISSNSPINEKISNDEKDKKSIIKEAESNPVRKQEKQETKKSNSKKFYAGVVAGPDLSTIKMQSLHKVGYNIGVVTGVQINKRIAIESGVLLDKKYYNSKGEYFNTNKISLPTGTIIKNVSGHCDMIEIPVNIHYLLRQKAGHNIYASAGVSSYLMNKEVYTFDVTRNGYAYPRSMDYDNPGSYAFAVVNLGVGYNKQIGKNGNLRIEPSIKLPVNKIGTGSMPIQSATLQVGYTRKLF